MAYDEYLADRIHKSLTSKGIHFVEKKMMGGLVFMVDDKMCMGVLENKLMARIDPAIENDSLQKLGAEEMMFTGRKMKGYIFVQPEGIDSEDDLSYWVEICLEFNPRANSSKKSEL